MFETQLFLFLNEFKLKLSWHPTKESIIAFGTKDGKVGIADIMSANKYVFFSIIVSDFISI